MASDMVLLTLILAANCRGACQNLRFPNCARSSPCSLKFSPWISQTWSETWCNFGRDHPLKTLCREYIYSSHFGYIETVRRVVTATVSHIHAEPPTGLHEAQLGWMVDLSKVKERPGWNPHGSSWICVWQLVRVSFPAPWTFFSCSRLSSMIPE